jgi:hypothetical protein
VAIENSWKELHRAALLELNPHELHLRIAVAEKAIQERIEELRRGDSPCQEERQALDDGLRSLRILASLEYQAPPPVARILAEVKVTP